MIYCIHVTEGASGNDRSDFLNEIEIMKRILDSSVSPHVMVLIGCVTLQEPILLVTAFAEHGDLWNYLQYIRKHVIILQFQK